MEDAKERIQARNVAITHLCVEIVALHFCSAELFGITLILAVLSSSVVACCCKHRTAFKLWSWMGGLPFMLHAIAAVESFDVDRVYYVSDAPVLVFFADVPVRR